MVQGGVLDRLRFPAAVPCDVPCRAMPCDVQSIFINQQEEAAG